MALQEAMSQGEFSRVAPILDAEEIESASDLSDWPAALHMLAHIHNSDLEDARLLHKRLPAAAVNDAQVQAAHRLLQVLWQKDYQALPGALRSSSWSPELQPLLAAIERKTREETAALLSRGYTRIGAQTAAQLLGLSPEEVSEADSDTGTGAAAHRLGWELEPGSDTYKVVRPSGGQAPLATPEQIRRLTEFVVHLES